ncbi:hypothetical protein H8E88_32915 [candidate division KSB1 bacterium]|nr:hypothetical protein [candidate division KSB1 bacterium]
MKNTTVKKIAFNFLFILITFVYVIRLESEVYSAVDFFYYPNLPTIELVVQPKTNFYLQVVKNLSPSNSLTFKKSVSCFFYSIAHKYLFKLSCISLIQQLPNEQVVCSPTNQIISILQKKNICHSSDDEYPAFMNWC